MLILGLWLRFIFEKAKELGVRSVVLDGPDSWAQTMATDGIIEEFVGLDFTDADTVFDRCVTAINAIKKVCTAHATGQDSTAYPAPPSTMLRDIARGMAAVDSTTSSC